MTFFKKISNRLKRLKNVVWQSSDGRVTSDHCRVTVQRLFFQKFFELLETSKKHVVRQSADGRVTTNHCCLTVQRLFSKFRHFGWIVAWPSGEYIRTGVVFATSYRSASEIMMLTTLYLWNDNNYRRSLYRMVAQLLRFRKKKTELDSYYIRPETQALILYSYSFFPPNSLFTYLLLQEWSHPGNFDIISKLGIGRREFLILAGKFQLIDSLWGKQISHYKHKRRSTTFCGRFPWKIERAWAGGQHTGKLSGKGTPAYST